MSKTSRTTHRGHWKVGVHSIGECDNELHVLNSPAHLFVYMDESGNEHVVTPEFVEYADVGDYADKYEFVVNGEVVFVTGSYNLHVYEDVLYQMRRDVMGCVNALQAAIAAPVGSEARKRNAMRGEQWGHKVLDEESKAKTGWDREVRGETFFKAIERMYGEENCMTIMYNAIRDITYHAWSGLKEDEPRVSLEDALKHAEELLHALSLSWVDEVTIEQSRKDLESEIDKLQPAEEKWLTNLKEEVFADLFDADGDEIFKCKCGASISENESVYLGKCADCVNAEIDDKPVSETEKSAYLSDIADFIAGQDRIKEARKVAEHKELVDKLAEVEGYNALMVERLADMQDANQRLIAENEKLRHEIEIRKEQAEDTMNELNQVKAQKFDQLVALLPTGETEEIKRLKLENRKSVCSLDFYDVMNALNIPYNHELEAKYREIVTDEVVASIASEMWNDGFAETFNITLDMHLSDYDSGKFTHIGDKVKALLPTGEKDGESSHHFSKLYDVSQLSVDEICYGALEINKPTEEEKAAVCEIITDELMQEISKKMWYGGLSDTWTEILADWFRKDDGDYKAIGDKVKAIFHKEAAPLVSYDPIDTVNK